MTMEEEDLQEIVGRIDRITSLLALLLVDEKIQKEQVRLLYLAGYQPKEIANLIGTTPNTVSVTLSKMRREERA